MLKENVTRTKKCDFILRIFRSFQDVINIFWM